ncbi:LacI family DNA-binding transcriptional regulator [Streptomyces sp. AC536]|nr:LacI family DNA-binding transcriptional regulator [Streptomyces buecherae]QNJ43053.1 LacI family DNA-binding transcriptional regulator [Streptomyces buecherae]
MTTMHDVARDADVSVATASHVLHATRPVRPAIRAGRPASHSARTRRTRRPRPLPTGRPREPIASHPRPTPERAHLTVPHAAGRRALTMTAASPHGKDSDP